MANPFSPRTIQVAGLALAATALAIPALVATIDSRWAVGLLAAMAAELVTGREAAIPLAIATGTPPAWIAATSILQNLALAALVVPFAAQSVESIQGRSGFPARFLRGLHETASSKLPYGRSAGVLFGFMLVPFIANGAVLAGLIGVLAGIELRRLIAAVVAAVVITATAWSFGYAWLSIFLAQVHPGLQLAPAAITTVIFVAWLAAATKRALNRPSTDA